MFKSAAQLSEAQTISTGLTTGRDFWKGGAKPQNHGFAPRLAFSSTAQSVKKQATVPLGPRLLSALRADRKPGLKASDLVKEDLRKKLSKQINLQLAAQSSPKAPSLFTLERARQRANFS